MKNKEINWLQKIYEALVSLASGTTVASQSDWAEVDSTKASFIKNKPTAPSTLEVANITTLTSEQLDALSVGDKVIKVTGTQKHLYVVTYKDETNGELLLTYCDWQNVEGVYYEKTGDVWGYVQTDNTHIAS